MAVHTNSELVAASLSDIIQVFLFAYFLSVFSVGQALIAYTFLWDTVAYYPWLKLGLFLVSCSYPPLPCPHMPDEVHFNVGLKPAFSVILPGNLMVKDILNLSSYPFMSFIFKMGSPQTRHGNVHIL